MHPNSGSKWMNDNDNSERPIGRLRTDIVLRFAESDLQVNTLTVCNLRCYVNNEQFCFPASHGVILYAMEMHSKCIGIPMRAAKRTRDHDPDSPK